MQAIIRTWREIVAMSDFDSGAGNYPLQLNDVIDDLGDFVVDDLGDQVIQSNGAKE